MAYNVWIRKVPKLTVYIKYVTSPAEITYSINSVPSGLNTPVNTTSCDYYFTIQNLEIGDQIQFTDTSLFYIAGATDTCPSTGYGCSYTYTMVSDNDIVYLSVDTSFSC
jgi:hypothetical protein